MPRGKKSANPSSVSKVETIRHRDTRRNIPTNELRAFLDPTQETQPPVLVYPRDTTLDPQLVWKGKDEQDRAGLTVPAVPIYIQEKIHPSAIVEEVRRAAGRAGQGGGQVQLDLFSDFNGISWEQKVEFYQHDQHWQNRMILGDSLYVMQSLAEKEGLKGQVQMIYLDPPYGIKFGSNWQVSTRKRDVKDNEADLVRQPEQVKAFRDTWELGIHSYLSYLRDRLVVARELLSETGSIFVQIGDENVHLVRSLLDEVFGSENLITTITFVKTTGFSSDYLSSVNDYLLWYARNRNSLKFRALFKDKVAGEEGATQYRELQSINVTQNFAIQSRLATLADLTSQGATGTSSKQEFSFEGKTYLPPSGLHWKTRVAGLYRLHKASRIAVVGNTLRFLRFYDDFPVFGLNNMWTDTGVAGFTKDKVYVVQTTAKVIERCMLMTTSPGDIVLDPTMGSGTTAYVAEQWGRRWITIDTSRVALALARTRLMAARFPFYLLADSDQGRRKQQELAGHILHWDGPPTDDVRRDFVYETVPHITLRDIANNEEIDVIHAQWQPYLEERLLWLNQLIGQNWEEWQVPRELPDDIETDGEPIESVRAVLAEYWQGRRERQAQIDASIARSSSRETLYDRPYQDTSRVRVTGPFTVESLSPHRMLDAADDPAAAPVAPAAIDPAVTSYEHMMIDNLRIAGVQNTKKGETLRFDTLEPHAGEWIQAVGSYTDAAGETRRVAISLGSEHGTVTPRQVQQAAKAAVKGIPFDLLVVISFAFDPQVYEEQKQIGELQVLIVRANSDLMMGDALKKTPSANLFTVFGEPDFDVARQPDGQYVVTLRGLDIYDPTTGALRASTPDDIACWFIDTDYDEESFFVRHAYFTGANEPYDQLKRALRAEIDEGAWSALYSVVSQPFPAPETGKIAVKVINHYGDEAMRVYEVG